MDPAVALLALVVAAFQPNLWLRLFWTALIALSSTAAWAYHSASQSEFTVFDVVSLWNARHETGRALVFYGQFILPAALLLLSIPAGPGLDLVAALLATLATALGVLVERWLFFAEAQHVVTIYYGADSA